MSLAKELHLDRPFTDLRHETMLNIVHTASQLSMAGTIFLRQFHLTEAQWNVLFALHYKQVALTQSELGTRLVVTRASITSVLDKLEEKGLVERQNVPGNRRIYHVELTRKGEDLFNRVEPLYRHEVHAALVGLNEKKMHSLIDHCELIRANLAGLAKNSKRNPQ